MESRKKLALRKDVLIELDTQELAEIGGANVGITNTCSCNSCGCVSNGGTCVCVSRWAGILIGGIC